MRKYVRIFIYNILKMSKNVRIQKSANISTYRMSKFKKTTSQNNRHFGSFSPFQRGLDLFWRGAIFDFPPKIKTRGLFGGGWFLGRFKRDTHRKVGRSSGVDYQVSTHVHVRIQLEVAASLLWDHPGGPTSGKNAGIFVWATFWGLLGKKN